MWVVGDEGVVSVRDMGNIFIKPTFVVFGGLADPNNSPLNSGCPGPKACQQILQLSHLFTSLAYPFL